MRKLIKYSCLIIIIIIVPLMWAIAKLCAFIDDKSAPSLKTWYAGALGSWKYVIRLKKLNNYESKR